MSELSEDPEERARKYIANFEKSLQKLIQVQKDSAVMAVDIKTVSDTMLRYLQDAYYYLGHDKPTTSLASIAYAEGLLDALTFLRLADTKAAEQPI
jgi:hypothetical protein